MNLNQMMGPKQYMQFQPPLTGRAPPPGRIPTPGVPSNLPDPTVLNGAPTMGNHMIGPYGAQAGLLGQQQPMQPQGQPGPYGAQAMQLAGLLGNQQQAMGSPYTPGMFMPGFRPGIDQPIRGGGGRPLNQVRQY